MNIKPKMTFRLLSILTVLSLNVFAQSPSVRGILLEKQSGQMLEFVSVSVSNQKSELLGGTLSNEKGEFSIKLMETGSFSLKIYALGFEATTLNFNIDQSNSQLNLGKILLNRSNRQLEELIVTGKETNQDNKLDKQTYKAKQFESAKGGSAVDVLKNLPSITVNSLGEISMRGSSGFLVLVNGKPVLSDAQSILNQIAANTIENIEIITAPTAKFDADGRGGIINIITKQGTNDGFAIETNLQLGLPSTTNYNNLDQPKRYGADFSMSFRKEKWDFSLSGNYLRNDINGSREGFVFTKNFENNYLTEFPSVGERSFDKYNYGGRAAVSFTPDNNNSFNFGVFSSKKYQQRRADIVYHNRVSDLESGSLIRAFNYFNSNLQTKEGDFTLASFDYAHLFKNKAKLSSTLIYEYAKLYGNTLNQNLDYPVQSKPIQEVTNPYKNPIKGYRIKLDYATNLWKGKLESGYQFRNDDQNGTFNYTVSPVTNQADIALFSGTASSKNQINAVYTQITTKVQKWQYTAGLRYEYAAREVKLSSEANPYHLYLSNLFPSLNMLYSLNPDWSLKAGYSKRVQRNSNYELNPIPEREHSETLEQGDPKLLPQLIDLVELGLNHDFEKGSFFSTLYYQNIENPIQRVNSVYADTILNRVFTNADKARLLGLELGSTFNPVKWCKIYAGINIYNYKISGQINVLGEISAVKNASWVHSINTNVSFDLGNKWAFQTNINYLSARPTAQGRDSRFLSPNASLKKTFAKGKYSLGLQWQNINLGIFDANKQRVSTWGSDFYTTTNYIYETDVLMVNFKFNLNKLSNKAKHPNSEIGEKEF